MWYVTQLSVVNYTCQFTFQITPANATPQVASAMSFAVANPTSTTNPAWAPLFYPSMAGDANVGGYGAYNTTVNPFGSALIGNCVAVKFDTTSSAQMNFTSGGMPNTTGIYLDGGPYANMISANDLNPYGINLNAADVMACTIVNDGSLVTMVLKDTTTGAQARYVWPVSVTAVTTSNNAWVGFTGGTPPNSQYQQAIQSWNYAIGYNSRLATPTFGLPAGQYSGTQSVTVSGPDGATLYYTTNGLLPTSSSTQVTGAISITASTVLNVVAIQTGATDSLVAQAAYQISTANPINFPSGFAANDGMVLCGHSVLNGSAIQLTDTNLITSPAGLLGEAAAAWWGAPINIQTFTASFQLQFTSAVGNGMTFCIQNYGQLSPLFDQTAGGSYVSGGPFALGNCSGALGYGPTPPGTGTGTTVGIVSSAAVSFKFSNNSVGIYTGGVVPSGSDTVLGGGVSLTSGHPLNVVVTYNGTSLTLQITDTVNSNTTGVITLSSSINIPTLVGANTAYVGFTAGTTSGSQANQFVNNLVVT
jgi:hypothetical protein